MKSVLEILDSLPIFWKLSGVFTLVPLYIFKDPISKLIASIKLKWFFKKRVIEITKDDLLAHDFFRSLKDVEAKVRKTDFSAESSEVNNFKRDMMVTLISKKTKSIDEFFHQFIESPSFEILNSRHFKFEMMTGITWLVEEYNRKAIEVFIERGVSEIDAKYFVHRYEEYRSEIINSFLARLESIAASDQYVSNFDRMQAMLEVLTLAVEVIPRDVKSLYVLINGRYDKYNKI